MQANNLNAKLTSCLKSGVRFAQARARARAIYSTLDVSPLLTRGPSALFRHQSGYFAVFEFVFDGIIELALLFVIFHSPFSLTNSILIPFG